MYFKTKITSQFKKKNHNSQRQKIKKFEKDDFPLRKIDQDAELINSDLGPTDQCRVRLRPNTQSIIEQVDVAESGVAVESDGCDDCCIGARVDLVEVEMQMC